VGHAWFILYSPDEGEILSHSGFTGGHSSYVAFSPGLGVGVVVLANFGREPTDRVGRWLLHHVVTAAHEQQTATPLAARRFFFKGDWANAAWAYGGVAARDPGNGEAAFRLGASLFQIRRFEEAANAWVRAAESGYDPARSLYNAGSALAVMGRRAEAVAALRLALDAGLGNLERIDSDADWRSLAGYPPFEALRSGSITPP
jgi:tetratricopeptide (TPR) repeat protein